MKYRHRYDRIALGAISKALLLIFVLMATSSSLDAQSDSGKLVNAKIANVNLQESSVLSTQKVTLNSYQVSIKKLLKYLEQKKNIQFSYNEELLADNPKVTVDLEGVTLDKALKEIFKDTNINFYAFNGGYIVLRANKNKLSRETFQERVQGTVTDAQTADTLPGVNIAVKGTTSGTSTDGSGHYSLIVPSLSDTLIFSFIGYETREVPIKGRTEINITLKPTTLTGEELVVVGFGTQEKENLTGSVSTASAEEIENRPVNSAPEALQGLIPGLKVTTNSGRLDEEMDISIRGTGTIGSSSGEPLVLIDGMEGDLSTLNPQDIENISVLKDAAAASIYGSRAPFGVILVETKDGRAGEMTLNYSNSFRSASPINLPDMMDSYTFAVMFNRAVENNGATQHWSDEVMQQMLDYQAGELTGGIDPNPDNPDVWESPWTQAYANVNLYKEIYKSNVFTQQHNISASGGSKDVTYYTSFNFLDRGGLLDIGNDGLNRYNVTGKINTTLTDWLKFNLNTRFTREDYHRPTALTSGEWGFYEFLGRQDWPNQPIYDPNGNVFGVSASRLVQGGDRENSLINNITRRISLLNRSIIG